MGAVSVQAGRLVREHTPLVLVLLGACLLRLAVAIAYGPALFYSDSWNYISLAYRGALVGVGPLRPSGYPLLLHLLSLPGRSLVAITTVQHLAGLAVGVLLYALMRKLGARRYLATVAAALVLLDAHAVALEQHVLSDAFFALALVAGLYLGVEASASPRRLAFSGLLLGAAATIRPVALFGVPIWILYLLWRRGGWRPLAAGASGALLPLVVYSALHASATGSFGLTQSDGWSLYGRVGAIAVCDGADVPEAARPLCQRKPGDGHRIHDYFVYSRDAPAHRLFGGISNDARRQAYTNGVLRRFALAIIAERPLAYAKVASEDLGRYFTPGARSPSRGDATVSLPDASGLRWDDQGVRRRYFPAFRPRIRAPAGVARAYASFAHTPRWLVAGFSLAALLALACPAAWSGGRKREIFLLAGFSLAMLIGSAATVEFQLRYLVPAVPGLVAAGLLALEGFAAVLPVGTARQRSRLTLPLRKSDRTPISEGARPVRAD